MLRVVEDADDGRAGLGSHLDQVQVALLRIGQCLLDGDYTHLVAVIAYQPHLRDPDPVVDSRGVPLGRAPIEPARDRHYAKAELGIKNGSEAREQNGR